MFFRLLPPPSKLANVVPKLNFGIVPLLNCGLLSKLCVCAPFKIRVPLASGIVVSVAGVMKALPLGGMTVSCLKPPGPLPGPLSPTVAKVF